MVAIVAVQARWRGRRCRRKIEAFRALPTDLWRLVLLHMRERERELARFDDRLHGRLTRLYLLPRRARMAEKRDALDLVHACRRSLRARTIARALRLAVQALAQAEEERDARLVAELVRFVEDLVVIRGR